MKSKKLYVISICLALVVAAILVAPVAISIFVDSFDPIPRSFDSASWKNNPNSTRFAMYADFLKMHKLDGMSKNGVLDVLGQPDVSSEHLLVYDMGAAGPDSKTTLEIYLDKEVVKSHKLCREM